MVALTSYSHRNRTCSSAKASKQDKQAQRQASKARGAQQAEVRLKFSEVRVN